eukprot:gb/GECG01013639.1/.p1 GENE.gb/GECG01013639.1/~~gb/GECG01013639.1/.p1  ORF type:complete len:136 (+),score=8.22 gb/GECG01013639.1/:1-408(+)
MQRSLHVILLHISVLPRSNSRAPRLLVVGQLRRKWHGSSPTNAARGSVYDDAFCCLMASDVDLREELKLLQISLFWMMSLLLPGTQAIVFVVAMLLLLRNSGAASLAKESFLLERFEQKLTHRSIVSGPVFNCRP